MTLIAGFKFRNIPCLLGDVVISKDISSSGKNIPIPTVGNLNSNFHEGNRIISDFQQKLHVISDRLSIGWSGTAVVARVHIDELTRIERDYSQPLKYIEDYFSQLDHPSEVSGAGILGWLVQDGEYHLFKHNVGPNEKDASGCEFSADC